MLFDTKQLKPLYELSVGQPGSSFTFEVAQFNGISPQLLDKAKVKVSESKIKIDQLTVELQKEKSKFKKINTEQYQANVKARVKIIEYDKKLVALSKKQVTQIQFFEQQNKFVNTGKKIYELIKKFKKHKTNKSLNDAVKKIVGIEQSKLLEVENPVVFNKNLKAPKLPDVKVEVEDVKRIEKELNINIEIKKKKPIAVGDKVRLVKQTKTGEVIEIKGNKVIVVIGNFTFTTKLNELEHFDTIL